MQELGQEKEDTLQVNAEKEDIQICEEKVKQKKTAGQRVKEVMEANRKVTRDAAMASSDSEVTKTMSGAKCEFGFALKIWTMTDE
ncbi:hypothetical protein PMIN06_008424 [Paraphaeosphaeria minitans]